MLQSSVPGRRKLYPLSDIVIFVICGASQQCGLVGNSFPSNWSQNLINVRSIFTVRNLLQVGFYSVYSFIYGGGGGSKETKNRIKTEKKMNSVPCCDSSPNISDGFFSHLIGAIIAGDESKNSLLWLSLQVLPTYLHGFACYSVSYIFSLCSASWTTGTSS